MSDAFSDCASDGIDRARARRKKLENKPKEKFVAYRWGDDSVSVFILVKEKLPYHQMSVKYPSDKEGITVIEVDNWGDYVLCNTLEKAIDIQTAAHTSRAIIRVEKRKLDNLFAKSK